MNNIKLAHLKKASMPVALPVISSLHSGQMQGFKLVLMVKDLQFLFIQSNKTSTKLLIFQHSKFAHLQVLQRRCPFLHWKIRVGGIISSKQTWDQRICHHSSYFIHLSEMNLDNKDFYKKKLLNPYENPKVQNNRRPGFCVYDVKLR